LGPTIATVAALATFAPTAATAAIANFAAVAAVACRILIAGQFRQSKTAIPLLLVTQLAWQDGAATGSIVFHYFVVYSALFYSVFCSVCSGYQCQI
jgi:hypothetical protein